MIGMISYLPDDTVLRQKRLAVINLTLSYLHKVFPEERINVVDQKWTDKDREGYDYVNFISFPEGIGAPKARNVLLEKFYKSEDGWLILSDDDISFYDYYDAETLLRNIYFGKYDTRSMDLIVPLSPQLRPFKEQLLKDGVKDYFIFKPMNLTDIPNFVVLRNTDIKLYFDEKFDTRHMKQDDDIISDDVEFIIRAMHSGLRCLIATCIIKKTLALYDSVIYVEETLEDTAYHRKLNDNLSKYVQKNFHVKSSEFGKTFNTAHAFRILRDNAYELPENLAKITRRGNKYNKRQQKLF